MPGRRSAHGAFDGRNVSVTTVAKSWTSSKAIDVLSWSASAGGAELIAVEELTVRARCGAAKK
jgi:hypothetical protein